MNANYIGILVGSLIYKGIKRGRTYYENLPFYEEAGKLNHLKPCFFTLAHISPGLECITAYVKEAGGYEEKTIPKPRIIHNRAYTNKRAAKKKIAQLKEEGIIIFNECNRYKKYTIHETLIKHDNLKEHLPETVKATNEQLKWMMEKYSELIIKPNTGTLGSHIFKLAKLPTGKWEMSYPQKKLWVRETFSTEFPVRLKRILAREKYLVQQRIPLATYKGNPFDLRVSVQRNGFGKWQVTGIVGKVAQDGKFLTNVAKGGTCYNLETLLENYDLSLQNTIRQNIESTALNIAEHLGTEYRMLADLGLDIGITEEGFPMFIECNARDLRVTFRNAKMFNEWRKTHITPICYGKFLLVQGKENEQEE